MKTILPSFLIASLILTACATTEPAESTDNNEIEATIEVVEATKEIQSVNGSIEIVGEGEDEVPTESSDDEMGPVVNGNAQDDIIVIPPVIDRPEPPNRKPASEEVNESSGEIAPPEGYQGIDTPTLVIEGKLNNDNLPEPIED